MLSEQQQREEILIFLAEQWVPVRQMLRTMSRGDSLTAEIFTNCLVREFKVPARLVQPLSDLMYDCCKYHDIVHTESLRRKVDEFRRERFDREHGNSNEENFSSLVRGNPVPVPAPVAPKASGQLFGKSVQSDLGSFQRQEKKNRSENAAAAAAQQQQQDYYSDEQTTAAAVQQQQQQSNNSARSSRSNTPLSGRAAASSTGGGSAMLQAAAGGGGGGGAVPSKRNNNNHEQQQQQISLERQRQMLLSIASASSSSSSSPRNNNNNQQQQQQQQQVPAAMLAHSHRGCTPKVDLSQRRELIRAQFLKATGGISVVSKPHFYEALNHITPWDVQLDEFEELYQNVKLSNGKVHVDDFCQKFAQNYVQNSSSFAASMRPCFAPIGSTKKYTHSARTGSASAMTPQQAAHQGATSNSSSGGGGGHHHQQQKLPPANPRASIVAKAQREQEEKERLARRVVRLTRASELRKEVGALYRKTVDSYDGYIQCGIIASHSPRRPSSASRMSSIGSAGVVTGTVHLPDPPLPMKYYRINTKVEADPNMLGNLPSPRNQHHSSSSVVDYN